MPSRSADTGDIFDGAVLLDEQHRNDGFVEGFRDGKVSGVKEGWQLGAQRGFHLAQEVGFIAGCCSVWQQRGADGERSMGPRTKRAVEALALQIHTFPLHDPSNTAIDESLADLKAKFKAIVAMMGQTREFFPAESTVRMDF
mmetsp:Transcript_43441/g.77765  ORF Transcript_43441/g.77765 Transcript_43441/m.77765 type:complete len:142 (-) Transcript_43441:368-793(-)